MSDNCVKSILFLGGGALGLPTIKWAKEIGFHVIVNDRDPKSPGGVLADIRINFDSRDVRSLVSWVVKNRDKYQISYCHCGSDFGLLPAAIIHDILKIPHSNIEAIINGLDKNLMKKCWTGNDGINFPPSIGVDSEKGIIAAGKKFGWPLVIKPTASSGSRGVCMVRNENEVPDSFAEAKKYGTPGNIIAEQFLEGSHHDVNGLFWNDDFFHCGVADRFFTPFPYCVPHHGYFPSMLGCSQTDELYSALEKGARSMGITRGPVKADALISDGKCYIYEITPRFHGDILISNTMGILESRNPLHQLLRWIFNERQGKFLPVDFGIEQAGGWKTIFKRSEYKRLKAEGIPTFLKQDRNGGVSKNNNEIVGLAWTFQKNRQQINKRLHIDDQS